MVGVVAAAAAAGTGGGELRSVPLLLLLAQTRMRRRRRAPSSRRRPCRRRRAALLRLGGVGEAHQRPGQRVRHRGALLPSRGLLRNHPSPHSSPLPVLGRRGLRRGGHGPQRGVGVGRARKLDERKVLGCSGLPVSRHVAFHEGAVPAGQRGRHLGRVAEDGPQVLEVEHPGEELRGEARGGPLSVRQPDRQPPLLLALLLLVLLPLLLPLLPRPGLALPAVGPHRRLELVQRPLGPRRGRRDGELDEAVALRLAALPVGRCGALRRQRPEDLPELAEMREQAPGVEPGLRGVGDEELDLWGGSGRIVREEKKRCTGNESASASVRPSGSSSVASVTQAEARARAASAATATVSFSEEAGEGAGRRMKTERVPKLSPLRFLLLLSLLRRCPRRRERWKPAPRRPPSPRRERRTPTSALL